MEKLQGSFKEESYFQSRNYNLLKNIRDQGAELSCDSSLGDWREFEKASSKTSLRGTCSLNKHKNCLEEAFFVNEVSFWRMKLRNPFLKCSPFSYSKRNVLNSLKRKFAGIPRRMNRLKVKEEIRTTITSCHISSHICIFCVPSYYYQDIF